MSKGGDNKGMPEVSLGGHPWSLLTSKGDDMYLHAMFCKYIKYKKNFIKLY